MTDGKRVSRRKLREQGKIGVRPADGVDISETTELRLRRPSRKEMREARKAETGAMAAVKESAAETAPEESAPEQVAPEQSVPEQQTPERLSVFDRFTEENDDEVVADEEVKPADEDKAEEQDKPEGEAVDAEDKAEDDKAEEDIVDTGSVTMRDRLLAMTRRQQAGEVTEDEVSEDEVSEDGVPEIHTDISRTSVMPADADLEAEELAQLVAPQETVAEPEAETSVADESQEMAHYEEDAPLNPRRTILNYILLILIAVLTGLLLGLLINSALFSASTELVPSVPSITELLL